DPAPLARARRRLLLQPLLLGVGHALLSRARAVGARRPHADAARAGAVRVLARLGARAPAPEADRDRGRARVAPPARASEAHRVHRCALRAGGSAGDSTAASVGGEQLAEPGSEPSTARSGGGVRARG